MTFKRLALVLLAFALTGCSRVQFAYNHAGWFLVPKLKSFTDFNKDQRDMIEREFLAYHRWHRHAMLPEYVKILRDIDAMLAHADTAKLEDMKMLRDEVQHAYEATVEPGLAPTARVLATLSDPQIARLELTFNEMEASSRREDANKTEADKIRFRDEKILDGIEDWVGSLSKGQKETLRPVIHAIPYPGDRWVEQRKKHREELLERLRRHESIEKLTAYFREWMVQSRRQQIPEFGASIDRLNYETVKVLNQKQLAKLRKRLEGFAEDFDELSRENR